MADALVVHMKVEAEPWVRELDRETARLAWKHEMEAALMKFRTDGWKAFDEWFNAKSEIRT